MQSTGLKDLHFPVYKLGLRCPEVSDGVVYYEYRRDGSPDVRIVDNKNIQGATLASRRLKMLSEDIVLYNLNTAVFFISDLMKLASPTVWWIDSTGIIFRYIKSRIVKLVFKKITSKLRITSGCLIEVEDIPGRFKSLYPPLDNQEYAGLLRISPHAYLLYGFYSEKLKDTKRKI